MLLMEREPGTKFRATALASAALAFGCLGDAFLYAFLPVHATTVGVPIALVGALLSINRFIRIFANGLMVHIFARHGLRLVMISASILAVLSTAGYTIATSLATWLFLRVCWGVAFSALRIGALGYALQTPQNGLALGMSRSLQEAGPMAALFLAPFLLPGFAPREIFVILTVLSLPAVYLAFRLPHTANVSPAMAGNKLSGFPSLISLSTFWSAALVDGIIVVVLGILFQRDGHGLSPMLASALAAFYLGYRRLCFFLLSPFAGWLADRLGADNVFRISLALIVLGLVVLVAGPLAAGVVTLFTFYSVNAAITPACISANSGDLGPVASNATWRDLGAGLGTLAGGLLIASPWLHTILLIAIFGLMVLLLIHVGVSRSLNVLQLWK